MADVSKLKLDNNTYDIKDATARILQNYSTNEQIIGTWIDGTNLYRKVITTTTTTTMGASGGVYDFNVAHGISNLKDMIAITGNLNGSYTFTQFGGNNVDYGTYINMVTSTDVVIRISNDQWPIGTNICFIIIYTKNS